MLDRIETIDITIPPSPGATSPIMYCAVSFTLALSLCRHRSRAHGSDYNVRVQGFCVRFINSKPTAIQQIRCYKNRSLGSCNYERIYTRAEAQHHVPPAVSSFHLMWPFRTGSFPPHPSHPLLHHD